MLCCYPINSFYTGVHVSCFFRMNMHAFIKHFSNAKLHCYKWSSRILTMVKYWLVPEYVQYWLEGLREKYFTAKGVRGPKSLGTTDLTDAQTLINIFAAWCN